MYTQILLGIWMLVNAGFHFFKLKFFLRKSVISIFNKKELDSYQKGFVLPYTLLGILFIVMGIIEGKKLLSFPVFMGLYVLLAAVPFALLFRNNKKHSGYYFW